MTKFKNRVGETILASNGLMATIIAYRSCKDIDVQFSDGTIIEHKFYHQFRAGHLHHPNINSNSQIVVRVGATNIATNGMKIEIVGYRNSNDIDIRFEDGVVVKHRAYRSFATGKVLHPTISRNDYLRNSRIGQRNINTFGQSMEIIAYRGARDIDVKFDNGVISTNRTYLEFKSGKIMCRVPHNYHIGETSYDVRGIKMTLINYRSPDDVDIEFETGVVVTHKTHYCFKHAHIGHPMPYTLGTITIDALAYKSGEIGNFYCRCNKCNHRDIMTIQEMRNHICQN